MTYSNVHRGSGHNSMVTTALFEGARDVVLESLDLDKERYMVVFGSPLRLAALVQQFNPKLVVNVSSHELGLPLGIGALAIERKALPKSALLQMGGGTVKMVYPKSVIWADTPARFEAGTPNIVNAIALAKALQLVKQYGDDIFNKHRDQKSTVDELLFKDAFDGFSGEELLGKMRKSLVGREVRVPTIKSDRLYINLDNAASTPTFRPIWNVVKKILRQPSEVQSEVVSQVKTICAGFLDAPQDEYEVLFASNTTEAISIAAQFLISPLCGDFSPVIVTTMQEHNSNELPWRYIVGASIVRLSVDDEGFVDPTELDEVLRDYNQLHKHGKKRVCLVAVSGASNAIGSIVDLQAISQIVHKYGVRLLVDGAQVVSHRPISLKDLGIDFFAFSGHKVYAPFGSGALVVKKELLNLAPADLSKIQASGEENVIGIAALGKAMVLLQRIGMDIVEKWEQLLTRRMLNGLAQIQDVEVFGVQDPESPRFWNRAGIIAISLKRVPHNLVAKELAEWGGIGIRNGCFCAHLLVQRILRIHPVRIFATRIFFRVVPKLTNLLLPGLVRISFGIENDEADVDHFLQTLEVITRAPRALSDRLVAYSHNGSMFLPKTQTQDRMIAFTENVVNTVYSFDKGTIV
ncbi:MAG: aminotransferase class V-fold PLP-dependent enzyme [Candidatus Hermodarchaeia archaeon]